MRDKVIEAARAAYLKTAGSEEVSLIVDAILDTLEANAKEWDDEADMLDRVPWPPRGMTLEEAESMHSTKAVWLIEAIRGTT